jgi:protein phosphatase
VNSPGDLKVAPFHLLAGQGATHFDKDRPWRMAVAERLAATGIPSVVAPQRRALTLDD